MGVGRVHFFVSTNGEGEDKMEDLWDLKSDVGGGSGSGCNARCG